MGTAREPAARREAAVHMEAVGRTVAGADNPIAVAAEVLGHTVMTHSRTDD